MKNPFIIFILALLLVLANCGKEGEGFSVREENTAQETPLRPSNVSLLRSLPIQPPAAVPMVPGNLYEIHRGIDTFIGTPSMWGIGNRIAWSEFSFESGTTQINLCKYDPDSHQCSKLWSSSPGPGSFDPSAPSVSANQIVWSDFGKKSLDLFTCTFNPTTGKCPVSAIAPTVDEVMQFDPKIFGGQILWSEQTLENQELHFYDIPARKEVVLTTNLSSIGFYDIFGFRSVWSDTRDGLPQIYTCLYDKTSKTCPAEPLSPSPRAQISPTIFANIVAFGEDRNDEKLGTEIYLYVLNTGEKRLLTTVPLGEFVLDLKNYHDKIIWLQAGPFGSDIFLYDLMTNQTWQVTDQGNVFSSPKIFGNRIVFTDFYSVFLFEIGPRPW